MKLAENKYVVKCFGVFYADSTNVTAAVVMEKMPFDLRTYLDKRSPKGELPWDQRFKVYYMHISSTCSVVTNSSCCYRFAATFYSPCVTFTVHWG